MKIIHIESGLGNQMLSYCELLALRWLNPSEHFLVENIVYDIPECNSIINQWNGYELNRVFGINAINVRTLFNDNQWADVIRSIRDSKFWLHNWNWPVYFQRAFSAVGLELKNMRGSFEEKGYTYVGVDVNRRKSLRDLLRKTDMYSYLQMRKKWRIDNQRAQSYSNEANLFYKSDEDELTGQRLSFKFINSGIERIEPLIRQTFVFPAITDDRNASMMRRIMNCNSVAIHARRGDMAGYNYPLYRFGYFRRCVDFIRTKVQTPVFFIFCDPDSVPWAKENAHLLGVDFRKDSISFIDFNKSTESYRDMQLMAACKHQIITQSSFGWWGAWLNTFPGKITCSPTALINTTHHFM